MATLNGHSGAVNKVAFSADGTAIIWNLNTIVDSENVLKLGCEWIKGYLHNNADVSESDRTICDAASNTP
ncbi:MAG TPA: hypothetical protein V6C65_40075 [Allocoleopsis sp.]